MTSLRLSMILIGGIALAACGSSSTPDDGSTDVVTDAANRPDVTMTNDTGSHPDVIAQPDVTPIVDVPSVPDTNPSDGSTVDATSTDARANDATVTVDVPVITDVTPVSDVVVPVDVTSGDSAATGDGSSTGDAALTTYSFANPLQIDLTPVFTIDTIANTSPNGENYPPLVAMDGSGYDYFTASVGNSFSDSAGGLPDNGFFASNADHPDVQFAFNDTSTAPNSLILNLPGGTTTTTFPIAANRFTSLQVYATSTEGFATVAITLNYTSGTSMTTATVPDWFQWFTAAAPVFVVQSGLSRFSTGGDDYSRGAALFGIGVPADPSRTLISATVAVTAGTGRLVIYGATAY